MPHSLSNTSVGPPLTINRVGGTSEFCSHDRRVLVTAVTSVRRSDRLRSVADSGEA